MKKLFLSLLMVLFFFSCKPFFLFHDFEEGDVDNNNSTQNPFNDSENNPSEILPDSYETDNVFIEAGLIGFQSVQNHTIHALGDRDFFQFSAAADTEYRIILNNISGFEPELSLYGSNDETDVIEMKNTSTYTGQYDWWGYNGNHDYSAEERQAIVFTASSDKTYFFSVRDIYDAHSTGLYSVEVKQIITVLPPETFSATPATNQNFQINLSWNESTGADSYTLYRSNTVQDPQNPQYDTFSVLTTVSSGTTSFADTDIDANTQYTYFITSTISGIESDPGIADSATFNWSDFKSNKDIIDASQGLSNTIAVTFKEKYTHPDILRYEVYRSTNVSSPEYTGPLHSFSAADPVGTVYYDENVTPGDYYFYCVKIIIDIEGVEQESNYSWFDSGVAE